MHTTLLFKNFKGRDHLGKEGIDERILLIWILDQWDVRI
jgi:hypothetical protein